MYNLYLFQLKLFFQCVLFQMLLTISHELSRVVFLQGTTRVSILQQGFLILYSNCMKLVAKKQGKSN